MFERSLYRRQNHVEAEIDQVYAGEGDDYISANNRTLVQNVIQDVEQGSLVMSIRICEHDVVRSRHYLRTSMVVGYFSVAASTRETNE